MNTMTKHTLKECFNLRARIGWQGLRSEEFIDFGPFLVTGTDFKYGKIDWDTCYHVDEHRFKQDVGIQLKENDLLVTKDGTVGKTAFVVGCPEKATLNSHIFLVRSINGSVLPAYLYYILNSHSFDVFLRNILTGTTIKGLTQGNFYKFTFDAPDVPRQEKIIEVLASVDEAIDKTRELIEKYSNIKTGMMQDLLDRGLLGSAAIVALGTVATIARGGSPRPIQSYLTTDDAGVNWIKIGDTSLTSKYVVSTKEKITEDGAKYSRKVKVGDFILSNSMSFGRPYILKIDGCIHDGWLSISDYENSIDKDYLYYILCAERTQQQFEALSAGSTVHNLKSETVQSVVIPLPSIPKQAAIAKQLTAADEKIQNERNYLAKLENIKQGLMQDLLTNKVSVDALL